MAKAPKNTKAFLIDASVRHTVYVNRFASSQINEMLPYLTRIRKATAAEIAGGDINDMTKKKLQRLYQEITGINAAALESMGKKLKGNMKEFAVYEKDFAQRMLNKGTKVEWDVPTDKQVTAAILSEPVASLRDKGLSIDGFLDEFSDKKGKQIVGFIQEGVIKGSSNQKILAELAAVTDIDMRNQLKTVIRTITMHVSDVARQEFYRENQDVIESDEWIATLDADTCIICGSLDHKIFPFGKAPDKPHPQCRCVVVPVVKKEFSIIGSVEGLERPARGAEGRELGISANTTYNDWLRTQPASFQDDILGQGKGQIFRDGGLKIDRFVNDDRQPLTLKELKNSDERAIKGAVTKSGILDDDE